MGKYLQMIGVLLSVSLVSGLALGGLNSLTHERAENNVLRYKKVPAVIALNEIVSGKMDQAAKDKLTDELLADKKELPSESGKEPKVVFVIKKDGQPYAVAFDARTKGYGGGEVTVMVGFNLADSKLIGAEPAVVDQTPGVGTRIKEEAFTLQFQGLGLDTNFKVKKDGGAIDGVSGATLSSRAAAEDVGEAVRIFKDNETKIRELIKQ